MNRIGLMLRALLAVTLTALVITALSTSAKASDDTTPAIGEPKEWAAAPVDPDLEALAHSQTQQEITTLLESGEALDTLYDPATETYLAARPAEPEMSTKAIDGKCLNNPARIYSHFGTKAKVTCWRGTGTRAIDQPRSYKVSAGGEFTTVWYKNSNNQSVAIATVAGGTTTFTRQLRLLSIVRG